MTCDFQQWQGTKIFKYWTCPAGQVTYNFHSSCKHMHMSFKSVCSKEHKGVICIWLPRVILSKALILQDKCLGKNYSSFLDFTRNYERTNGIFVPWMGLVWPANTQTSLCMRTDWSEPLLVALIFYDCSASNWTSWWVFKLKRRLHRLIWVYTCQKKPTLLEITCRCSFDNFRISSNGNLYLLTNIRSDSLDMLCALS